MIESKKGDKVIVKGFTGIKLGVFEVASVTKKTITVNKRNGDEMIFDRKTGRQVNVEEGKEKYANSVMEDDGSFVAPSTRGASKKAAAKKTAKAKPAPVEDDEDEEEEEEEDEEDEEEEEPVKPAKKPAKKTAPAKKPAKKVVEEDDDDDDDFEEVDD